jgi:hypothetical protein
MAWYLVKHLPLYLYFASIYHSLSFPSLPIPSLSFCSTNRPFKVRHDPPSFSQLKKKDYHYMAVFSLLMALNRFSHPGKLKAKVKGKVVSVRNLP